MSGQFEATVEVDRGIDEVFTYLADGRNDPRFSPRVLRIERVPESPTAVGTVFRSTVKDAGMKTSREFRVTAFDPPRSMRWAEVSKNLVTAGEGGYDLQPLPNGGTRVRIHNVLEGHGLGKLLVGLAVGAARKDAPAFGQRIKAAIEADVR
ncbi:MULTISPECIES: SRPBCC family protein [Streptomyces]|uniref:SRPBCC family protein n=1 Tax=Streptomyces solicathayae TaxID=3081768 RepID=A0ABZ0LS87_9ACTN|nr:SRPBCC family protein [Streptomyces sp. HUAS YS2]WOX22237.1 SRPBCC family protein [Streptomyces sp. HUAS YS2]